MDVLILSIPKGLLRGFKCFLHSLMESSCFKDVFSELDVDLLRLLHLRELGDCAEPSGGFVEGDGLLDSWGHI